ncbi:MAG: FAD-binding protein [Pirellulales bacterium]
MADKSSEGDRPALCTRPSGQSSCTIGGNVATNSGGPHTLKYGVTVNHILGVEAVLADGQIVQIGGPAEESSGLDLTEPLSVAKEHWSL